MCTVDVCHSMYCILPHAKSLQEYEIHIGFRIASSRTLSKETMAKITAMQRKPKYVLLRSNA